tara:strand:+ start:762 stop:1235 length:474 start_codon:yes stop_codon:yes gene_type:complete
MTTTNFLSTLRPVSWNDYEAIEAVLVEAARILTDECEINVRCRDDLQLDWRKFHPHYLMQMTPLRDNEMPRDGDYFWWGHNFHSGISPQDEKWFGMHMVPVEDCDDAMYCCSLDTGLDSRSTDPRAIARALERTYRDFCARRAAGDHHPDEYSSLND